MNGTAVPGSPQVLVVDDAPAVRDVIVRWLQAEGYACAQAANADSAWEFLKRHDVALVTLDLKMPGRSGLELLHEIKLTQADVEVLVLTASGETHAAIESLTRGACGYLIKPVEREELLRQVSRGLERRRRYLERVDYTRRLERQVREQSEALQRTHDDGIHRLVTAAAYRDEETGAHIRRTGLFSGVLAAAAGWNQDAVRRIRMAAPMHDIGKIGIPDRILGKPGLLTPDEFEIMKQHTTIGAEMLAAGADSPVLELARRIALSHHERWDGSGYPQGLAGRDIPEAARIVAIVDVYDALTHDRIYRPALTQAEALRLLRGGRSTHFDPALLDLFFSRLPEMRRIAEENPDNPAEINHVQQMFGPSEPVEWNGALAVY